MAIISLTCPHCLKERMTFDVAGCKVIDEETYNPTPSLVAFCRNCNLGVALLCRVNRQGAIALNGLPIPNIIGLDVDVTDIFPIEEVWPVLSGPDVPLHLPKPVERAFLQAERSRLSGSRDAAGMMYRKALDVGSKHLDPSITDGMLAGRLKRLAAAGKLTPDIAQWADQIRLLGNEATHEDDAPSKQEVDDLANLTRMVLVYLFEMPERVKLMRAHKEGAGAVTA